MNLISLNSLNNNNKTSDVQTSIASILRTQIQSKTKRVEVRFGLILSCIVFV
jgi:hypothetical protein